MNLSLNSYLMLDRSCLFLGSFQVVKAKGIDAILVISFSLIFQFIYK